MFGWFRRNWVSRDEHEAMILEYEEHIVRMEKLVEMSMEAATQALKRSSAHINLVEVISEQMAGKTPTTH